MSNKSDYCAAAEFLRQQRTRIWLTANMMFLNKRTQMKIQLLSLHLLDQWRILLIDRVSDMLKTIVVIAVNLYIIMCNYVSPY